MEKRVAKVIKEEADKWILKVEGITNPLWLYKDKANRSGIGDQIQVGLLLDVEIIQNEKGQWRVDKAWLNKFEFPTFSQTNENFYLKIYKQRLFDESYKFDKEFHKKFQHSKFNEALIAKINNRNIENAEQLLGKDKVKADADLVFHPDWRLVVGLGGTSVYETVMTLHHVYGIPYLPASAIKGIVRSYVIKEIYKNEIEAFTKQDFCDVFGCNGEGEIEDIEGQKHSYKSFYKKDADIRKDKTDSGDRVGRVIFFDAFPEQRINLEADIMNPHYPEWYNNGTPPADWQNPIPIPFLTIGKDTSFQFVIGVKQDKYKALLEKAKTWLIDALTQHGIGAKTSVGYGYMQKAK